MNNPDRGVDVSGDGQRFLMLQQRRRAPDVITGMVVVQNWTEDLKRLTRRADTCYQLAIQRGVLITAPLRTPDLSGDFLC